MSTGTYKLQKVLADLGLGSRREMERWIGEGRIDVDGEKAHLGQRVGIDSQIEVDGKPVKKSDTVRFVRLLVMNKRVGEIVSRNDPQKRPTVFDSLPKLHNARWISIGRLDINTSGLLLFTNLGLVAHRLMHPSTVIDREYAVRVVGKLTDSQLETLRQGALLDNAWCRFTDIRYYNGSGLNHWYHVVLMEGRNKEVRNLFEHVGVTVSRLKRVRFGPFVLPRAMPTGKTRELGSEDVSAVCNWLQVPAVVKPKSLSKESLLIPYPGIELKTTVH